MSGMLYGITATDPLTFTVVALLFMVIALAACYIPARRAMRVDPMVALRYEYLYYALEHDCADQSTR
jgi:putative ABC transport system permease protein